MRLFRILAVVAFLVVAVAGYNSMTAEDPGPDVLICHIPPDNPNPEANAEEKLVGARALQPHLDHGDCEGSCDACFGDSCTEQCEIVLEECIATRPPPFHPECVDAFDACVAACG